MLVINPKQCSFFSHFPAEKYLHHQQDQQNTIGFIEPVPLDLIIFYLGHSPYGRHYLHKPTASPGLAHYATISEKRKRKS